MSAREKFQAAANLMEAEQRMKKSMWGQFWSAHQRFFKYLCIASKVGRVVQLAREEVHNGKVSSTVQWLFIYHHTVGRIVVFDSRKGLASTPIGCSLPEDILETALPLPAH